MSSTKAKIAAALAASSVLGIGWEIAAANTIAPPQKPAEPQTYSPIPPPSAATTATTRQLTTFIDGTYTGTPANYRFGQISVTVEISNGTITRLTESVLSDGHPKSDDINRRSIPALKSEVLATNSTKVSTVSGATYTTRAYLTSLQAALDQAR